MGNFRSAPKSLACTENPIIFRSRTLDHHVHAEQLVVDKPNGRNDLQMSACIAHLSRGRERTNRLISLDVVVTDLPVEHRSVPASISTALDPQALRLIGSSPGSRHGLERHLIYCAGETSQDV